MPQYNKNLSTAAQLLQLHNANELLRREVDQLRRLRHGQHDLNREIRWAITHKNYGTDYPDEGANTFAIRFLDAHFTKAQGLQTFTNDPRSEEGVTYAHAQTGQYIPEGLPIPVFWQRGLGGEGKGEWWFLDPPLIYDGKIITSLAAGGSADCDLWLFNSSYVLERPSPVVTISIRHTLKGTELPQYTQVKIAWQFQVKPAWTVIAAACEPDETRTEWELS